MEAHIYYFSMEMDKKSECLYLEVRFRQLMASVYSNIRLEREGHASG